MPATQAEIARTVHDAVRCLLQARQHTGSDRFTDSDSEWGAGGKTGPMASMQGLRTVFGAAAMVAEDTSSATWRLLLPALPSLLGEWQEVLDQIEKEGFAPDPYDAQEFRNVLAAAGKKDALYLDSVSWALSTAVLINYCLTQWAQSGSFSQGAELIEATRREIVASIRLLLESQCEDGGWSWMPGFKSGHLLFTWSVIEGLADLYDYVLGESKDDIEIGPDEETIEMIRTADPDLLDRVRVTRDRACAFLSQRYLEPAIQRGLKPEDLSDPEAGIQFVPKNPLVMVYCELFLLEALILTGFDIPGGLPSPSRRNSLEMLYRTISTRFPQIRATSFASDAEASTLTFEIRGAKAVRGRVPVWIGRDAGLWPQLVRTLVLFRFYTKRDAVEDPDIVGDRDSALRLLLDSRRLPNAPEPGLWDKQAYNLGITARSVEGLIDCYDYFDLLRKLQQRRQSGFQQAPEATRGDGASLPAALADAVYPHIEDRLRRLIADSSTESTEAPPVEGSPRVELAAYLKRADFGAKLVEKFGDALDAIQPWPGITQDLIVERLLGKKAAEDLQNENREAYALLRMLAWVSFCVGTRMLDLVLQETLLYQEKNAAILKNFRERDGGQDPTSLQGRIRMALERLKQQEMEAADRPPEERPSYRDLVDQLFGGSLSKRSKKG